MAPRKTKAKSGLNVIKPGDEGYIENVNVRGKADVVSPELNPIIEEMLENGEVEIQLPDGDPFSVSQIRYWAPKATGKLLPEGKRISVAGGKGKNISISIVDEKAPAGEKSAKVTPTKKVAKKAAAKRPAKRAAAKKDATD